MLSHVGSREEFITAIIVLVIKSGRSQRDSLTQAFGSKTTSSSGVWSATTRGEILLVLIGADGAGGDACGEADVANEEGVTPKSEQVLRFELFEGAERGYRVIRPGDEGGRDF